MDPGSRPGMTKGLQANTIPTECHAPIGFKRGLFKQATEKIASIRAILVSLAKKYTSIMS